MIDFDHRFVLHVGLPLLPKKDEILVFHLLLCTQTLPTISVSIFESQSPTIYKKSADGAPRTLFERLVYPRQYTIACLIRKNEYPLPP